MTRPKLGASTAFVSTAAGEIKALTSLRGIAAMAVVITHFSATAQRHADVNCWSEGTRGQAGATRKSPPVTKHETA
jgi:peptidoglycan/LPS O-acetylase OafA/YrhL